MTPRERTLAAIRHQIPDRIPVDSIAIENLSEVAAVLGIEVADVPLRLGLDGRVIGAEYLGPVRPATGALTYTLWGTPNTGTYSHSQTAPLATATSVADIEHYAWPDPALYDYASAENQARTLGAKFAVRGPYWVPIFCRVCDLFNMEGAMMRMHSAPTLVEAALDHVLTHVEEYCRRLMAVCGDAMPILCLADDFATQRGLMISPAHWRRFLKPCLARLFALGRSAGKVIWFHSCGDITSVLPDLIDIGMDVWETVQLHALPLSPQQFKREYGRHITFFGGINTQRLPFQSPDEVRAEVLRAIELLGKNGGYICGPDHHIKRDVPAANTVALFDAATAFRRTEYTQ